MVVHEYNKKTTKPPKHHDDLSIELGGFKRDGWLTVNLEHADLIHNLNQIPYPFHDNQANKIMLLHTLEHLNDPKAVMAELYRIAKPSATVTIEVPYWKKDMFTNPEHKNYFKPEWFSSLRPDSLKYRNMQSWCPYNFRILKLQWIRGKHAKWRKYGLKIVLEAVK